MKKRILIIATIVLALLPIQGYALEFDIWITGQTKNKVITKAKKNEIQLNTDAKEIYYRDTLFQEKAQVSFAFTQKTNILYAILIDWRDIETAAKGEALSEKIGTALGKKYIKDEEITGNEVVLNNKEILKNCTTTTIKYKGGISSTLFRCNDRRFMRVRYRDSKLEKQNAFEKKKMLEKQDSDSGKF